MGKEPNMVMMNYNAVLQDNSDLNDTLGYCHWLIRNLDLKNLNSEAKEAIKHIKEMAIKRGAYREGWDELLEGM